MKVAWLVSIIGAATYMAYIIALILPIIYPYCPFKVPLTLYVHRLYQFINDSLIPRIGIALIRSYTHMFNCNHDRHNCRLATYRHRCESILRRQKRPLKEIEYDHVRKWAAKVDVQSLHWLHSSTYNSSNSSVHQSVLQACSGMTSTTLKFLPDECLSTFVVSLHQRIEQIEPLGPSPGAEREFELCYRAYVLLRRPKFDPIRLSSDRDRMADRCSNEQLKMVLHSMTSFEKASTVLLGILRGPQRSSLTLHSAVWKALVYAAGQRFRSGAVSECSELELELMEITVRPVSTRETGDVTTIDKPTEAMRGYILNKFLPHWNIGPSYNRDQRIIVASITRIQERLCHSAHASDRKHVIKTSLTIIECTGALVHNLAQDGSVIILVLNVLYSLLSSEAFVVVSPDLQPLACKIFIILDSYRSRRMEAIVPELRFYSVAYQCYLHSLAGGGERSENDVIPRTTVGRLISSSLNLPPASSMDDSESHKTPNQFWYPLFSIDGLVEVMLLLIKEHHESVLYDWAQHPAMQNVWPECLSRLVRWTSKVPQRASGERGQFRQWDFLKRVLAVVVIGELQNILGHSDDNESLPQYDYDAYKHVNQLPWLHEVGGSSRAGEHNAVDYAQIAKHPKFQEFLYTHQPSQENTDAVAATRLRHKAIVGLELRTIEW
ncbi:hypothetical protein EDD85DRAFT_853837 [Armillaria nabsnona]|nr:hypothetical protein EDD85DRAFT_853837 [Armillaria nabsnona]